MIVLATGAHSLARLMQADRPFASRQPRRPLRPRPGEAEEPSTSRPPFGMSGRLDGKPS